MGKLLGFRDNRQAGVGSDVEPSGDAARDALAALRGQISGEGNESILRVPGEASGGGGDECAVGRLIQAIDAARGKALRDVEKLKARTIVTKYTVLRADPQKSGAILEHCQGREIGKPFGLSV